MKELYFLDCDEPPDLSEVRAAMLREAGIPVVVVGGKENQMKPIGVETTLEVIARRAWEGRLRPDIHRMARYLTDPLPTVADRVAAIAANSVRNQYHQPLDSDEAVLIAATLCLTVGIPCRIVGGRRGESWTCLLSYQDGDKWVTIDVLTNRAVLGELDEVLEVKMPEDDETQVRVVDEKTYHINRSVILVTKDPEGSDLDIQVTVGSTVSSYKDEPEPPAIQIRSPSLTRKQWELAKRLGDRAWNEYERRFSHGQK